MAIQDQTTVRRTVVVDTFTDGLLGPDVAMAGPVADGGHIVWNSTPGCWGPMITPAIRGGHEVCTPVFVEGAEVGDAIAIRIKDIAVTSKATSSGNDQAMEGRFNGDPYCAAVCPGCGAEWPETRIEGIGETAIRCTACGADATPFTFTNGYTVAFDGQLGRDGRRGPRGGIRAPRRARPRRCPTTRSRTRSSRSPRTTSSASSRACARSSASSARRRRTTMPDSHNAGDFGAFLVGAPHKFALDGPALQEHKTDGHLDIDAVRAGAMLVCPVKVAGGGVYLGDMHAMQGDGEIAGHTADVAGTVTLQVEVIKGLGIDGPVLFPLAEDLPFLAKPLTAAERARAEVLAAREGVGALEESLPISVIGTGPDLNSATDNGLRSRRRAAGHQRPRGHEPSDDRRRDRDRPRARRRPGHVPRPGGRATASCAATQRSCMPERDGFAPGTPELGRPLDA